MIQEIARANDQPAVVAGHLIDRAAFGDHPLGRPVLGPEEHLRELHARGDRRASASAAGRPAAAARSSSATPTTCRTTAAARRAASAASQRCPSRRAFEPAPTFAPRHAGRAARDQPVAPAPRLPRRRSTRATRPRARRARHLRDAARRLDGLAPLRRDPRAARPLLLGLGARSHLRRRAGARARRGPRLEQVPRGLRADARDRRRAARATGRARRRSSARAPTPAGGACSRSRTPAPSRATPPSRRSSTATTSTPTPRSRASTRVTFDEVVDGRARDQRGARGRLRRAARRRRLLRSPAAGHPFGAQACPTASDGSGDRDHPLDRAAAPRRRSRGGTRTSCTPSRSAVAELRQRDHLHEAAARLGVGGDELDLRRRPAQRVEHADLGRDDRARSRAAPARRSAACRRSRACGPPRRRCRRRRRTPCTLVEQPHSGWIRNSASGCAARVAAMSAGRIPAWTWHSPSQTCIRRPSSRST